MVERVPGEGGGEAEVDEAESLGPLVNRRTLFGPPKDVLETLVLRHDMDRWLA